MNKTSEGNGISAELFLILKDDAVKVLHSKCQQIFKTQQWPHDWKRSVFIPISKKGKDLTQAEEIKKRWQEYTEEEYKKALRTKTIQKRSHQITTVVWSLS